MIEEINEKDKKMLKLQQDYESGKIEQKDMSEEDFDGISRLYDKQIELLNSLKETYKEEIGNYEKKIKHTLDNMKKQANKD